MYIALCSIQLKEREEWKAILGCWQQERRTGLRLKTFRSGEELLEAAKKEPFTLYLLEITSQSSGLETARKIREIDERAEIVFVADVPDYAYASYSVHAMDYLLKPVKEETLFSVLDQMLAREQEPREGLTLKHASTLIRIPFSHLVYVEVNDKHLYFNLTDGTVKEIFGAMNEYASLLLERPEFVRIHRSYIVNMLQVVKISLSGVQTFSGQSLPVSRQLYPQLQKEYIKLMG